MLSTVQSIMCSYPPRIWSPVCSSTSSTASSYALRASSAAWSSCSSFALSMFAFMLFASLRGEADEAHHQQLFEAVYLRLVACLAGVAAGVGLDPVRLLAAR